MKDASKYNLRGVSAQKTDVHEAIKHLDKGLFPNAFCKILPDIVGNDKDWCNIMHADTAGTKTALAYLYWKETGDLSVWKGIAQDAIVMNIDDMACVGCIDNIVISSTIGRNKHLIPGEVLKAVINGATEFFDMLADQGVQVFSSGGETADVGDIVRTIDVGFTTFCRLPKSKLVVNNIKPGQVIIGIASDGQATYENEYNSGIGSNGLTSARHDVLSKYYANNFIEAYAPQTPKAYVFNGSKRLTDKIEIAGHENTTVGKMLLSPTRTFLPVLKPVLSKYANSIHGIIHCTGGAQTKVLKFTQGTTIIKDNLFDIPPIFKLIQEESKVDLSEMYQVFNMGNRLEFYVDNDPIVIDEMISLIRSFGINSQIIGHVEEENTDRLKIKDGDRWLKYS